MLISYILMLLLIISTLGKKCDDIICANIFDEVCAIVELEDRTQMKSIYQNICLMKKAACEEKSFMEIRQVQNELCNLEDRRKIPRYEEYPEEVRRVFDFSIVGAHQACNHSCPTFCTDSYEPACAQIWKRNMMSYTYRPMINHCHIDLFSCAAGVNVTIQPLGKCYKNPSGLLFMQNVAAMKSLKLLDEGPNHRYRREANVVLPVLDSEITLKKHFIDVVRRVFAKYRTKHTMSTQE